MAIERSRVSLVIIGIKFNDWYAAVVEEVEQLLG
jgi:hypothetical protein